MSPFKPVDIEPTGIEPGYQGRCLMAGLKWEPRRTLLHLKEFDLDLSAYVFGSQGRLRNIVTGDLSHQTGEGGMIWHTGDDTDGAGNIGDHYDDERIFVVLDGLAEDLTDVFFVVTSKNAFSFGDVESPEVRLADGGTKSVITFARPGEDNGGEQHAFIFAHVKRTADGWAWREINEYAAKDKLDSLDVLLRPYLADS